MSSIVPSSLFQVVENSSQNDSLGSINQHFLQSLFADDYQVLKPQGTYFEIFVILGVTGISYFRCQLMPQQG